MQSAGSLAGVCHEPDMHVSQKGRARVETKLKLGGAKTYNTGDSPVVTDLSTDPASSLSRGERTGSRVFYYLWSYVLTTSVCKAYLIASWVLASLDPQDSWAPIPLGHRFLHQEAQPGETEVQRAHEG